MASMYLAMGVFSDTNGYLDDVNIEKEIKKIKNSKPYKNRGTRIEPRTEPKVGRNELCPCGSGKKYKRCCLKTKK